MSPDVTVLSARRRRAILIVVGLALMMVVSAVSGLNVALPDLARDTGASQTDIQWIVDAYAVVFAGLLLAAGAIGDRYGRKGILLAGLILFGGAASVALGADDPSTLIALRAIMGIGAAAVMPVTLSIITTSFPAEERGRAVGVWVGIAGGGAVIGLLGSGILLEFFDWSSFFGLNVALAAAAIIGTLAFVPTSRDADPPRLDIPGALLSLAAISTIVFGFIEGPERGWSDALTVTAFAIGIASLIGFVAWELHIPEPMLDPRLFRLRGFETGSLALMVQFFASFGFFYIALQYLQYVAGFSPLRAAVALLPLPAVLIPVARRAPDLAHRYGMNRVGAAGLSSLAIGLAVLSTITTDFAYWQFTLGLVLFAAGAGLTGTPATTAIVSSLPVTKQGVASAVNDTSRELGSALGIAILGSILNAGYRDGVDRATDGLPDPVADGARSSIAFVQSSVVEQLGPAGVPLVEAARQAFVDGVSTALLAAAGIVLVTALIVVVRAPRAGAFERQTDPPGDDVIDHDVPTGHGAVRPESRTTEAPWSMTS